MANIQVIEYSGSDDWLLYHYPVEDLAYNSRLFVMKGQVAILFIDGKMIQTFREGMHHFPGGLSIYVKEKFKILSLLTRYTIYFVRQNTSLLCDWGLSTGFHVHDQGTDEIVPVGAYGNLSFHITDYTSFIMETVGQSLGSGETMCIADIQKSFISFITMKFKEVTLSKHITYSELPENYSSIADEMVLLLNDHFENHGLKFDSFVIEAINRKQIK